MTDRIRVLTVYPPTVTVTGAQKKPRGPRKRSLATIIKRAKQMGVDVTVLPDGSATFRCSQPAPLDSNRTMNEWDEELYGSH